MCAKKKQQDEKKVTVGFTIDPSVKAWLEAKAQQDERSMSYIVNKILKSKAQETDR